MRVLLISPLPPPVGGVASWTKNLLAYYSKKQDSWEMHHLNTAIKFRNITDLSLLIRFIGGIRDTFSIIKSLHEKVEFIHPDVIHLTSSASFALVKDLLILSLVARKKIPVIVHFRFGRIPEISLKKNWEWHLLCKVVGKSKKSIVIDNKSYSTLKKSGFENIANIPNPISKELEDKVVENLKTPKPRKNDKLLFIGHVIRSKGVFELVKACTSLHEIKNLTIIGPFQNKVKEDLTAIAQIRDSGNWLTFLGVLDNKQTLDHLCDASIFILPSYTEGFPNVIIEAMAMGCPIISTGVGAIPEILDINSVNPCGVCISQINPGEISAAITALLKDTRTMNKFGINGMNKVLRSYSISKISKHYESIWAEAAPKVL